MGVGWSGVGWGGVGGLPTGKPVKQLLDIRLNVKSNLGLVDLLSSCYTSLYACFIQ